MPEKAKLRVVLEGTRNGFTRRLICDMLFVKKILLGFMEIPDLIAAGM